MQTRSRSRGVAIGGSSSSTNECPPFVQVAKNVLTSIGRVLIVEGKRDLELLRQDRCPLSDVTPIGTCVRIRDPSTAATALHLFPEMVASSASEKGRGEFLVAYFPYVDPNQAPKAFKCRVVSMHRKLDVAFLELENATPDADWMPMCAGPTKLGCRLFSAAFPHLVDIAFLESDDQDVQIHTISPIVNDFLVGGNVPTQGFFGSYFCNLNSSEGPIFSVDAAGVGEVHGIHTKIVWSNIKNTVMPEDDEIPSDDEGRDEML